MDINDSWQSSWIVTIRTCAFSQFIAFRNAGLFLDFCGDLILQALRKSFSSTLYE